MGRGRDSFCAGGEEVCVKCGYVAFVVIMRELVDFVLLIPLNVVHLLQSFSGHTSLCRKTIAYELELRPVAHRCKDA